MDGLQQQKRTTDFELNKDFLSSMPSEIIENILVKLPIRDAVKTSILSSKWKFLWVSIPDLVFNEDTTDSDITESVDKVLQVHQGPIWKFKLDYVYPREEAINRWLPNLFQNGLRYLCLWFGIFKECKVPLSLFSCHKLQHLSLSGCIICAPQFFQGFKLLCNLKLCGCDLVGITIDGFVASCPLLESLTLHGNFAGSYLAICAPNLKQLTLFGTFTDLLLLETPRLISARIFPNYNKGSLSNQYFQPSSPFNDGCKSKILQVFGKLSNIEGLKISSIFCEYLASDPIPEKFPVTFHHLKKILIDLPDSSKEVEAVLCIVRNAPNLKKLYLWVPSKNIWEEERITTIPLFKQLEVVKILGFKDVVSVLAFVKFIFSTASKLEKLVIDKDDINFSEDGIAFLMKLASFSRLSSKAVILFDFICNDDLWPSISDDI